MAVSFLLGVVVFANVLTGADSMHAHLGTWFSVPTSGSASLVVNYGFLADSFSALMALVVTGVGTLIHIFSLSYMEKDPGIRRYFAYLNLFVASMLILILADNLPLLFLGWEGVGFCSYLLIGFWWKKPAFADAGRKAFIFNRVADMAFLTGIILLGYGARSLDLTVIRDLPTTLQGPLRIGGMEIASWGSAAAFLLVIGCMGKSAQWPLHVWLKDAMAGPTPVSALIHAATMVTAGIYLTCRLNPLFVSAVEVSSLIACVGTITALSAALIACFQQGLKRTLAYSTVSQLGFMFAARWPWRLLGSFFSRLYACFLQSTSVSGSWSHHAHHRSAQ